MRQSHMIGGLVAALLLGACAPELPDLPLDEQTPDEQSDETPAEEVEDGPPPLPDPVAGIYAPLTGEVVDDRQTLDLQPILAIKVENQRSAFPQAGIGDADVVIEHLTEGGLTRLTALFHDARPHQVGPMRSARLLDAELLGRFPALALASTGGRAEVVDQLAEQGIETLTHGRVPGMHRTNLRAEPDNVFANLGELERHITAEPDGPVGDLWAFSDTPPSGGETVARPYEVALSPLARSSWRWDDDILRWRKTHNGAQHDALGASPLAPANVVILHVDVSAGSHIDVAGNPTTASELVDGAPATVLRDARRFDVTYHVTPSGWPELRDEHDRVFPLQRGPTWMQLRPR